MRLRGVRLGSDGGLPANACANALANAPALVFVTHHVEEIMPAFSHALLLKEGQVSTSGTLKKTLTSKNLSRSFGDAVKLEQKNGRYTLKVKPKRKGMM